MIRLMDKSPWKYRKRKASLSNRQKRRSIYLSRGWNNSKFRLLRLIFRGRGGEERGKGSEHSNPETISKSRPVEAGKREKPWWIVTACLGSIVARLNIPVFARRHREGCWWKYRWKLVYTGVAQGVAQFRQELLVNAGIPWLTRTAPFSNPPRNREWTPIRFNARANKHRLISRPRGTD